MARNHRHLSRSSEDHRDQDRHSFSFDAGAEAYDYTVAIGGFRNDHFVGNGSRDYLWGLSGNDHLYGRAEDDALYGDSGNDLLVGLAGADHLNGGGGNDRVYGGDQNDAVIGGAGNDYLDEGVGHGMLEGGSGHDVLVGGQGPDAFIVDPESGNDVILDFTAGPGMSDHLGPARFGLGGSFFRRYLKRGQNQLGWWFHPARWSSNGRSGAG